LPTSSSPTPDFLCPRHAVHVEVACKLMHGGEAAALRAFFASRNEDLGPSRHHSVFPGGSPKVGETIASNVASKFCAIKADEHQVSAGTPMLLWVDLHDEDLFSAQDLDQARPLCCSRGRIYSGPLWLAYYGRKGMPVLEEHPIVPEPSEPIRRLPFDGRFRRKSIVAGVVLSFPQAAILFENPDAECPLPVPFVRDLLAASYCRADLSFSRWPECAYGRWGLCGLRGRLARAGREIRAWARAAEVARQGQ
jgi:hypothetical protein